MLPVSVTSEAGGSTRQGKGVRHLPDFWCPFSKRLLQSQRSRKHSLEKIAQGLATCFLTPLSRG